MPSFTLAGVYILVRKPDLPFSLRKSYFFIFPQFAKIYSSQTLFAFNFVILTFIWPFFALYFLFIFPLPSFCIDIFPVFFFSLSYPRPLQKWHWPAFSPPGVEQDIFQCTVYINLYLDTRLEISTTMRSSQCNYLWKVHLSHLAVDCSAELR